MDVSTEVTLLDLVRRLRGEVGMFKVGKELFTSLGPRAVELIRGEGAKVFLDLKFHDIPNTVAGAVRAADSLGVEMLTVHASGGTAMLRAAVDAASDRLSVIAVTVLTSLDQEELHRVGLSGTPEEAAVRLGRLAIENDAHGLVCSALELQKLRSSLGPDPLLVTPGIRPAGSAADDQARVATPRKAIADGADFLVIGRPITRAPDPAVAAEAIAGEIGG
jgi:orotidine-5'-phosphate decarboxylase